MSRSFLRKNWYWCLTASIILGELFVFLLAGEHCYIGIHDNLDIHIADYQLLRQNNAFFSHGRSLPLLGGIDRNYLLSEFSLYALLYMLLPVLPAYLAGHFITIGLALLSGILLARDILGNDYRKYEWIVVLASLTYGLLPLYPAFSFSFASLPLFLYLIRRIEARRGRRYYLFLFFYPLVSYFTFVGLFLLGYLFLYTIFRSILSKKQNVSLWLALPVLSCGYIAVEYRLFLLIFVSGEPTIRDTMVMGNDSAPQILSNILTVFRNSIFHAEDLHRVVVFPAVLLYAVHLNTGYLRRKEFRKIPGDLFNRILFLILLNCIIYGIYNWQDFRTLVERLIPPLKGWQFNRTVFLNPFLWYLELTVLAIRLVRGNHQRAAAALMCASLLVPLCTQSLYNDFYNTVYVNAYRIIRQRESETLSFREFYSEDLFEKIKQDIGYQGEYAAAYGFHPAVLTYNGIATLDGCLSYYSQSYKEDFRRLIAPALEASGEARIYFDEWGGRAYLFSGSDPNIWEPVRTLSVTDHSLLIDPEVFTELGGTYIFSRIELDNAAELSLSLVGEYRSPESPYTIWVWRRD